MGPARGRASSTLAKSPAGSEPISDSQGKAALAQTPDRGRDVRSTSKPVKKGGPKAPQWLIACRLRGPLGDFDDRRRLD
jgi:hypothetical protein